MQKPLPPGQYDVHEFPRFGLPRFAHRFPKQVDRIELQILGDVEKPAIASAELETLSRVEQVSDFHCVTTWSCRSLRWSGYLFSDFLERIAVPRARPVDDAWLILFCGQDGYRASLPLEDLLHGDVLLADRLNGLPLTLEHGAPIRLIAPLIMGTRTSNISVGLNFTGMSEHIVLPPTASWTILEHASHSRSAGEEFPAQFCVTYTARSFGQRSRVFVRRCGKTSDIDFSEWHI